MKNATLADLFYERFSVEDTSTIEELNKWRIVESLIDNPKNKICIEEAIDDLVVCVSERYFRAGFLRGAAAAQEIAKMSACEATRDGQK